MLSGLLKGPTTPVKRCQQENVKHVRSASDFSHSHTVMFLILASPTHGEASCQTARLPAPLGIALSDQALLFAGPGSLV